ncbi:MAG: GIY-YIG nuclease family protein [bacterium]|nr:GIY-YIG nuclease family protein [bacterium]
MHYVYILRLSDGSYYHGFSDNLRQRIHYHQHGAVSQTKKFLPAALVFYAAFASKRKAIAFEKYLKASSGFAFRNKRLV